MTSQYPLTSHMSQARIRELVLFLIPDWSFQASKGKQRRSYSSYSWAREGDSNCSVRLKGSEEA